MSKLVVVALLAVFCLHSFRLSAEVFDNPDGNTLWKESFAPGGAVPEWKSEMTLAVENGELVAIPGEGKDKQCAMGRYVRWDCNYPYLTIDFTRVEQLSGYKGMTILNSSTGGGGFMTTAGGYLPGLWTFNVRQVFPDIKEKGGFFLRVDCHGAKFFFKSFSLIKEPENFIVVEKDSSGQILHKGDKLKFKVILKEGGKDVTIGLKDSYLLTPLKIGGNNYLQLTSDDKGKTWHAELTISDAFAGKQWKSGGLIVEAVVLGGKIERLYTAVPWEIKIK